ncbi:MAG: hypothetical protein LBH32_12810 [Dysgonamonadaceae bacterium]|jgi:hypothetical protein|nr:hypothetical protein [Dysgonamonadaceae bacterium]
MKKLFIFLLLVIACTASHSQDFVITSVDKQVKEYGEKFDFSTPLDAYVSFQYLLAKGKNSMFRNVSSFKIQPAISKNAKDVGVPENYKNFLINQTIKGVVTYKDPVAAVVCSYQDSLYSFRYFTLEENQWLNCGEDVATGLSATYEKVKNNLGKKLLILRKINEIKQYPTDTMAFVNYLEKQGKIPQKYIIEKLIKHRIVVYGEIHRRRISWELMQEIINDPTFHKTTGTIFMELSSDKQNSINKFFSNKELDTEIIKNIFREMQLDGWYDRGGYEFLISLWKLNKSLPEKEKIRVVFADVPMPLSTLRTKEEYKDFQKNFRDRNEQMANIIEYTVKNSPDKRHNLFIVGMGHACKSPTIHKVGESPTTNYSAVYQLVERFTDDDVFSIMPHVPGANGKARGGMFDYAFAYRGNKPVAFDLHESLFGKEVYESYEDNAGTYENNYDGYVFLCPLEDEEGDYFLFDLITDDFADEIKRRTIVVDAENEKWFDVENKNITKEAMLQYFKKAVKPKRWGNI